VSPRSAAGQASLEYVAAIALVAAVFLVAAPAVGPPALGSKVVHGIRLGLCVVADDICSDGAAQAAGVAPCPLASDTDGAEAFVTAFSIELGGRAALTVTPQSDGTVTAVWAAGGSGGASAGLGWELAASPVRIDVGASGTARARIQAARGWSFPDRATAERFLEHALRNAVDERRWPPAWHSVEAGRDVSALVGAAVGGTGFKDRADLAGVAASAQAAAGGRLTRDGLVTLYLRVALDGPELSIPLLPSVGRGRDEWLVEYTLGPAGPREIAFRRAEPGDLGNLVAETVARLDLRDPANYAVARPLVETRLPWPPDVSRRARDVLARIGTHGVIERTVSEVDDDSRAVSGSVRGGWKFGAGGRRIDIHKRLVDASARTGGPYERDRFDCTGREP
jgi:hypothetical protein